MNGSMSPGDSEGEQPCVGTLPQGYAPTREQAVTSYNPWCPVPPHTSLFYRFRVSERLPFGAMVGSSTPGGAAGDWVFHCHIFQHGENGMMSFLRVYDGPLTSDDD